MNNQNFNCLVKLTRDPNIERMVRNDVPVLPARRSARLLEQKKNAILVAVSSPEAQNIRNRRKSVAKDRSDVNNRSTVGSPMSRRTRSQSISIDRRNVIQHSNQAVAHDQSDGMNRQNMSRRSPNRSQVNLPKIPPKRRMSLGSHVNPKPILNVAHKGSNRRKSVSFDRQIDGPNAANISVSPVVPMDLTTAGSKSSTVSASAAVSTNTNSNPSTSSGILTGSGPLPRLYYDASSDDEDPVDIPPDQNSGISAGDILVYQNRIDDLIKSNEAKINRIKQLATERDNLLGQINGMHRINRSLTETVDLFRAVENGDSNVTQQRIEQLETEIANLRNRVQRLNGENFGLTQDNQRMKTILATHSKKILGEHNYNL